MLYQIGPITLIRAMKEERSPASSPCGTSDLAPSATSAAVTPNIWADPKKPMIDPAMRPRNENNDAPNGESMDDSVANAVKCLIPSFRTIWLPTIFAIMLMIPNMATNEEKSFGAKFHFVFARI